MKIKRKFEILTLSIITLFLSTLIISFIANTYVYNKAKELVNVAQELDLLTALETTLTNLEYSLSNYLINPSPTTREHVEKAAEHFYRVVSESPLPDKEKEVNKYSWLSSRHPRKTEGFKLDEDEIAMLTYLKENTSRVTAKTNKILYSSDSTKGKLLYNALKVELFEKMAKDINDHRRKDIEKAGKVEKESEQAQKRLSFVFMLSFFLLALATFFIRAVITKKIITPLLNISHMSYLMASGNLDRKIEISSKDELQELGNNFNLMAGSLRDKIKVLKGSVQKEQRVVRELAILNEFIGYVSSELKFETILQRFIERTKDLMKAEDAAIILFQPDGTKSFLSTDKRIVEQAIEEMLFINSKGLIKIITEQKPVRNNDIILPISEDKVLRNFIAIPLHATTGLQSLLVVINRQSGFSQNDEDSLFNFAFQAFQTISLQNELARLATTDGLTGLYNHRMFQDRLSEEILRAARYQRNLFLLIIDIDHFKSFNDAYGHQTGDDVLRVIARIIKGNIRKVDFPARYGGEEFVVILPESDRGDAHKVAERIREAVMTYPFYLNDGSKAGLTVSIGGSCFPEDATEKEDLIRKADKALYYAKNQGRNRVSLYMDILEHGKL